MPIDGDKVVVDLLWKMYQEQCTQARHHETQRSTVSSAITAISAALIGIASLDKHINRSDLPTACVLIALGLFGAGFSFKHQERFSLYVERAREYRDSIDELVANRPLVSVKKRADQKHTKAFPRVNRWHVHMWWIILNLFISVVGGCLAIFAIQS